MPMPAACRSSGQLLASAVVKASAAKFYGVEVVTDGTNTATVTIYDNASAAAGTILSQPIVAGAVRFDKTQEIPPVAASNGLYCNIAGTGAKAIVYFA